MKFWQAVVLVGSFFSGLGILLILQELLPFEYHSYKGTVGFAAFRLYPEQRELYLYLLTLLIVPLITFFGYFFWFTLTAAQQKICPINLPEHLKLTAFSYFIWFLIPLLFYAPYRNEDFLLGPIVLMLGLSFVGINLLVPFFYKNYEEKRELLMVHVGVFLLGTCPGFLLLATPGTGHLGSLNFLNEYSFWILFATGGFTWFTWLISSYLIARWLAQSSPIQIPDITSKLLPITALTFLPFAILSLETLFWAEYVQGDKVLVWYNIPYHTSILILITFTVSGVIWVWLVCRLLSVVRWRDGIAPRLQQQATNNKPRTTNYKIFLKIFFWGAFPLIIYAVFFQADIQRDIDFFHEGEKLFPAQALLQGKVPYKDVFFVHGLFEDLGMALAGFKLFGESMEGYRILEALLKPLAVVSYYYLGLLCLPYEGALLLVGLILTGLFPIIATERTLIANISLSFAVAYLRYGKRGYLVITAFTAFLSFLTASDTGLTVILAQGGLWFLLGLREAKKERGKGKDSLSFHLSPFAFRLSSWKPAFIYGSFLFISFVPFIWYLVQIGAWEPFIFTYKQIFKTYDHWTSLPLKTLILGISDHYDFWESYFLPFLILLVLIFLRFKIYSLTQKTAETPKQWESKDWILVLLLLVNIIYFKRGLDRSDVGHTLAGSHFGWIMLLFLLTEIIRINRKYALIYLFLIALLFIPTLTVREGKTTLPDRLDWFSRKNSIVVTERVNVLEGNQGQGTGDREADSCSSCYDRLGQLFLSPEQAQATRQMVQFFAKMTRPNDYIWDFTNHGAFYFLTDRLNPTRYALAQLIITEDQQRELIHDLQRHPPKFIIFHSQTHLDETDGVSKYLRHYLVSDYLLRHYKPSIQIANFTLLEPGVVKAIEEPYRQYLFRPVDFGYVPFLWGRERYEEILAKTHILKDWKSPNASQIVEYEKIEIDPKLVTYLIISLKVNKGKQGQLFWTDDQKNFNRQNSLLFSLRADGIFHPYIFRLASLPGWIWVDKISGLRLDLTNGDGTTEIKSIKLVSCPLSVVDC